MPRRTPTTEQAPSHDSFLDIVANMVGILIILVMLVGVRAKNAPLLSIDPPAKIDAQLQRALATETALRKDVHHAASLAEQLRQEAQRQRQRRDRLAVAVSLAEHQIESQRARLDEAAGAQFDLRRALAETSAEARQLRDQREQLLAVASEPIVVESFSTPKSRVVDAGETQFQLRGGRIVRVPFDELLDRFREVIRHKKDRLRDQPELTDTIGPIDGFRLKYTLRRHDIPTETALELGYAGSIVRLERAEFLPVASDLGEPAEEALAEGSQFRRDLAGLSPQRHTITLWTYPDSFDTFRRLRSALHAAGFAVAGRPLPHGVPISGSPDGTKSSAE